MNAFRHCTGGVSFESVCRVAYRRGRLTVSLSKATKGSKSGDFMMAVNLSEAEMISYIENDFMKCIGSRSLTVACINSPKNMIVPGEKIQIIALKKNFRQ